MVLIWAAIRPLLNQATRNVETADDCLSIDVEVASCNVAQVGLLYQATLVIRRNAGEGELTNTSIILSDGTNSQVFTKESVQIGATKTFVVIDLLNAPSEASVAALVGADRIACNPVNDPVVCV